MIPDASVATRVTSARPIISAAAVDAVRCGFRRAFSRPTRVVEPSGITPGKSAGHSGVQLVVSLRTAITTTIASTKGFHAPATNASTRFQAAPGPQNA